MIGPGSDRRQELQLRELQEYAAQHQWEIVHVYQDTISGASTSRRALSQLMDDARSRKLDTVLYWKLDRFGRSLLDCLPNLRKLDSHGVRFIAATLEEPAVLQKVSTKHEPEPSWHDSARG